MNTAQFIFAALLLAHSWYPHDCCNENECRPVPCAGFTTESKLNAHGFRFDVAVYTEAGKKFYALRDRVQPSPDDLCHACFWPGTFNMRCIWWPRHIT